MFRKNKILTIAFIMFGIITDAQTGSIRGKVTSEGKSIELVSIGISQLGIGSTTGSNGYFEIKKIPYGTYQIQASCIGYEPFKKNIEIRKKLRLF